MFIRHRLSLSLLLPLVAIFPDVAGHAQQPAPNGPSRITLDVVVADRSNSVVPGLTQQDFTLLDNKATRPITSFRALGRSSEPVEIILVLDTVNASYHTVAFARTEVDRFLHQEGGQLAYPTKLAVVTDTGTQITQGFSTEGSKISSALDHYTVALRSIGRSTGVYGADERFTLSLTALEGVVAREAASPGRKIIVWISPGWPLLSGPRIDISRRQQQQLFSNIVGLSTALRKAHTTLYSVDPLGAGENVMRTNYYKVFLKGIEKPSQVEPGDLALQVLATQTGGLALSSDNEVSAMLARCYADVNTYYEIGFDSPPADHPDEYHHIELQVNKPGVSARTTSGYYIQPQSQAQISPAQ